MTTINKSGKLLVVETATAMLHVLKNFTGKQGYDADHYADPADACERLDRRFQDFSSDYRSVILGWPEGRLNLINDLLKKLNSADHDALPLIIIAQEINADVKALVKRRPKTQAFLWSDYQQISQVIDLSAKNKMRRRGEQYAASPMVAATAGKTTAVSDSASAVSATHEFANGENALSTSMANRANSSNASAGQAAQQNTLRSADFSSQFSVLLVDTAPSVCEALRQKLESAGYSVAIASTVEQATQQIVNTEFDVVVTDFFLQDESGEALCQYLQSATLERKPVSVVLTAKYSDSIVKRSLAVGAAACLYKNESTELLFARIDALTRTLRHQSRQVIPALPVETETGSNRTKSRIENSIEKAGTASLHTSTRTALQDTNPNAGSRKGVVKLVTRPTSVAGELPAKPNPSVRAKPMKITDHTTHEASATRSINEKKADISVTSAALPDKSATPQVAKADGTQERQTTVPSAEPVAETSQEKSPGQASIQPPIQPPMQRKAQQSVPPDPTTDAAQEPVTAVPELLSQLNSRNPSVQYTVLMLDIEIEAATGDRMALAESEPMQKLVANALRRLYKKHNAQSCTDDGKFVLLLTTAKFQDALVLTRKILQVIPKMVPYLNNMKLVAHAGVLRIGRDESVDAMQVIARCEAACQKARRDGKDNAALVLPNNQYLSAVSLQSQSAFPQPEAQPQKSLQPQKSATPQKTGAEKVAAENTGNEGAGAANSRKGKKQTAEV